MYARSHIVEFAGCLPVSTEYENGRMLSRPAKLVVCWIVCSTLTLLNLHMHPTKKVPNKSARTT